MLQKMKEFKRGIHQLQWENRKCEMEVSQRRRTAAESVCERCTLNAVRVELGTS